MTVQPHVKAADWFPMTHAQLQAECDGRARYHGWRILGTGKVLDARTARFRTPWEGDGKGWADRLYVRAPFMLYVDFKTGSGRLTAEQRAWMDAMREFPFVVCLTWRPADWRSGVVERMFRLPGPEPEAA